MVASLKKAKRVAFVTPPQNGYVVVYDEEADSQDTDAIAKVASLLSKEAPTLAVLNHDDDILCYWLYEQGKEVDTFNSCPDYFEEVDDEQGGDAKKLCAVLRVKAKPSAVEEVLRGESTFAVEQHESLRELLGLPSWSVGFGYKYVLDGELENEMEDGQLMSTA